jgi:hypothetical protein
VYTIVGETPVSIAIAREYEAADTPERPVLASVFGIGGAAYSTKPPLGPPSIEPIVAHTFPAESSAVADDISGVQQRLISERARCKRRGGFVGFERTENRRARGQRIGVAGLGVVEVEVRPVARERVDGR